METRQLFGRRQIYTDVEEITPENVVEVLRQALSDHAVNQGEIQYLKKKQNAGMDLFSANARERLLPAHSPRPLSSQASARLRVAGFQVPNHVTVSSFLSGSNCSEQTKFLSC